MHSREKWRFASGGDVEQGRSSSKKVPSTSYFYLLDSNCAGSAHTLLLTAQQLFIKSWTP